MTRFPFYGCCNWASSLTFLFSVFSRRDDKSPNQGIELTATRCAISFSMTFTVSAICYERFDSLAHLLSLRPSRLCQGLPVPSIRSQHLILFSLVNQ
jgi:hypothetical protein